MDAQEERKRTAKELLARFSEAAGVPGHEGEVRQIFRERLAGIGEIAGDRIGSILCFKEGEGPEPRVLLDAHMDEVGFLVQSVTPEGFLRMVPVGGWWGHVLPAQRVRVLARRGEVPGVVASVPPHFLKEEQRKIVRGIEELFVDVGAKDSEDVAGRLGIRPGDPIVPDSPFREMADPDVVTGKAFDDRAGCALVVHSLLEASEHPGTLVGVGSVQEEVGCRGASTAVEAAQPHVGIVLEGTPADDVPGAESQGKQGCLGRGVQIRLYDPTMIAHRPLADFVLAVAEEEGIPHQLAVRTSGGTNASRIHLHRQGVPSIVLGVPVRYIHSHVSVLHMDDYLAALELVLALVRRLDRRRVESLARD